MEITYDLGDNKFNPFGEITHQETVAILTRTARVFGYYVSARETDLTGATDQARESVNFVVDRNIMTGTDNDFEHEGKYTKEQTITTTVRFYENLK